MDFIQIKELISLLNESSLRVLELSSENFSLKLSKNKEKAAFINEKQSLSTVSPVNHAESILPAEISVKEPENTPVTELPSAKKGDIVCSPLVGTFYRSASPKSPPFVEVGSRVKKGDVLCIVEAMKIMNEITSKYEGTVVEILIENEGLCEYNQPLFRIE